MMLHHQRKLERSAMMMLLTEKALEAAMLAFAVLDTNGDGKIDSAELEAGLINYFGVVLTKDEVALARAALDANGDGSIDLEELKPLFSFALLDKLRPAAGAEQQHAVDSPA